MEEPSHWQLLGGSVAVAVFLFGLLWRTTTAATREAVRAIAELSLAINKLRDRFDTLLAKDHVRREDYQKEYRALDDRLRRVEERQAAVVAELRHRGHLARQDEGG